MNKNYFTEDEFECKCGCGINNFDENTKKKLNTARILAGIPFALNSACRCPSNNKIKGGTETSSHIATEDKKGCAVDIKATTSKQRYAIINGLVGAGFNRIGVAKTFIHADDDVEKSSEVIWLY